MNPDNLKIIGVSKDLVTIEIIDITSFAGQFKIGSYIKIPHTISTNSFIIGIIKNYFIKNLDLGVTGVASEGSKFIIEVELMGSYKADGTTSPEFERGAHGIPLPPNNGITILTADDYNGIYQSKINASEKFIFSNLVQDPSIEVPVNGNKFFNKHFAIVGSTGTGKSHTVASILQSAIASKSSGFTGLNNSHIVMFDIHGEYKKAFPSGNHIDYTNIKIPYWLFDGEELGDLFIESNEDNSHNQVSQFRYAVTESKKRANPSIPADKVYYDSPLKFDIYEVIQYIKNLNKEVIGKLDSEGVPKKSDGTLIYDRIPTYFSENINFTVSSTAAATRASNGPFHGDFERFLLRLENIINNPRLNFLFEDAESITLEQVLKEFLGYAGNESNITIIDLSGIPFEVLSVTVSLISRILFEYGYYYKKHLGKQTPPKECETPLVLIYEEAHKYVPKSDLVKYRASRNAIERIAKEGRKYGVTLGIISQRPSEISETIFSQCNNFIAMRLTNPEDQNYVRRLLPDTLGDLTGYLSSLQSGEALIIGESIVIPSLVKIKYPTHSPESADIKYFDIWSTEWKDVNFHNIEDEWKS